MFKNTSVTISLLRNGDQGMDALAHFDVNFTNVASSCKFGSSSDISQLPVTIECRFDPQFFEQQQDELLKFPCKRPLNYYQNFQSLEPGSVISHAAEMADPYYFHKDVFDDDGFINLPSKTKLKNKHK